MYAVPAATTQILQILRKIIQRFFFYVCLLQSSVVFITFYIFRRNFYQKNNDECHAKIVCKIVPRSVINYDSPYCYNIIQNERRRPRSRTDVRLYNRYVLIYNTLH